MLNYEDSDDIFDDETIFPSKRSRTRKTRKDRKRLVKGNNPTLVNRNRLELASIYPKTDNQELTFDYFEDDYNLLLHGLPGTGKTFLSLGLALAELEASDQRRSLTIVRSVVPTRDIGFLPGTEKEKSKVYEAPYAAICAELYCRGDAYEILKAKKLINFMTTSFIRGITISDTILVVDEAQNLTDAELHSIITRVGKNTKVIFSGDFGQNDLIYKRMEQSGIVGFMKILANMPSFRTIEFDIDDIVRSGLVKEYIIARHNLGM